MISLKKLTTYIPDEKSIDAELLTLGISFLQDEKGQDWYKSQSLFKSDTLKIAYGADGIIRSADYNVSALWPLNMSVAEVGKDAVPAGFDINGGWMFDGNEIAQVAVDHVAQSEEQKQRLLTEATLIIAPLQDAADLGIASEAESDQLLAWKRYRIEVNRVDTNNPVWPLRPT